MDRLNKLDVDYHDRKNRRAIRARSKKQGLVE